MIKRFIRRVGLVIDRIFIRTEPMGAMNQASCGMILAQQIFAKADAKGRIAGRELFDAIPPELASVIIRRDFDPYNRVMTTAMIRDWLWDHVVFDGNAFIIAIHDHGEILTVQDGWQCEAEWFSRVRMDEDA